MNLASPASRRNHAAERPPAFPPSVVVAVKALVCELPHRYGLPLSRWSLADIQREVVAEVSWPKSAAPPCGAGSAARRCAHGDTEAGSFHATPTSPPRPLGCLTSTRVAGTA